MVKLLNSVAPVDGGIVGWLPLGHAEDGQFGLNCCVGCAKCAADGIVSSEMADRIWPFV